MFIDLRNNFGEIWPFCYVKNGLTPKLLRLNVVILVAAVLWILERTATAAGIYIFTINCVKKSLNELFSIQILCPRRRTNGLRHPRPGVSVNDQFQII